jgi:hypothetical protein
LGAIGGRFWAIADDVSGDDEDAGSSSVQREWEACGRSPTPSSSRSLS